MRRARAPGLMLALLLAPAAALAQPADAPADAAEAERRLEAVRAEIRALAAEIGALETRRGGAAAELREADRTVATAQRALRDTDAAAEAGRARVEQLGAERARLADGLADQREALAVLLRAGYAMGRHQQLKLLLAQDRIEQGLRALAYQRYVSRDRVARIEGLLVELADLARVTRELEAEQAALAAARAEQQSALEALEAQRAERAALVARLDAEHADRSARMAALGRDEQALVELLERLRDVFADIPEELDGQRPFAELRGRLPPPLAGRVLTAFGGRLPDGRGASGWLLEASAGEEVRAVAHGRVAFAEWMRGYGLIAIVDHGEDWMTLYAHQDALLVEAGDWVRPGQALGTAGSSGGQGAPALYFEIRRGGKPVDPAAWLRR